MMESEKDDIPTESMYAKAASLLFVDDGGKMTAKQAMNFTVFSEQDCKIKKHCSTIHCHKRKLVELQSRKTYHLPQLFQNNILLQYRSLLRPVLLN